MDIQIYIFNKNNGKFITEMVSNIKNRIEPLKIIRKRI